MQHKRRNIQPISLEIPILPELQAIIDVSPNGELTFLVTPYGRRYADAGFGNRFRDEAGLTHCSSHGLRKATALP